MNTHLSERPTTKETNMKTHRLPLIPFHLILATVAVALAWAPAAAVAAEGNDIPDGSITVAVEAELVTDEAVPSHLIDVSTREGIVTLSGTVDHLLAKDRAVTIAKSTKGVRAVVDRMTVKPVERADAEVLKDVETALAVDPAADSYEIKTTVKDGTVTLSGTVESWQEKQLAATVAKGVRGVKEIKNDLSITHKANRTDAEIKADVERRLETDVMVDHLLVDVAVDNGTVTLTGTVGSAAEKTRAESDAWVTGTKEVNADGLRVEWWARDKMRRASRYPVPKDAAIKKAVKDALLYDPRVLSFNPTVTVSNGVVTLTGTVDNASAKQAAGDTAQNTIGVWRVHNYLRVRPELDVTDKVLEERVRKALKRNPYVERSNITVVVMNGNAYLYGDVDSWLAKDEAERVARGVNGVVEVTSRLKVDYVPEPLSDRELAADVRFQLYWDAMVDEDAIDVSIDDGTVTLTGTVNSWYERHLAEQNARDAGADTVRNNLKVQEGRNDSWWLW
jgi:osmotically-inducible protein OsmY